MKVRLLVVLTSLASLNVLLGSDQLGHQIPLQTASTSRVWAGKEPWRAVDGNQSTFSQSEAGETGQTWLRVGLGELYCVAGVTIFWDGVQEGSGMSYICSEINCSCKTHCEEGLTVMVYNGTNTTTLPNELPSTVGCRVGDTIQILDVNGWGLKIFEIIAFAQPADCRAVTTWNKVRTEPQLPVPHDTNLTLDCDEGYRNLGGSVGYCLDGVVVSRDLPPNCTVGAYRV
ncbi:hypothetical protein ACHWQZ_G013605 [Mnemiopsis leidyi]